jgi:NTP pyrophosphatase (non-canonical NTP hydrolase)
MTHAEIVAMCDQTLNRKASEYATPQDRWHNFYQSAVLFDDFRRYHSTIHSANEIDACLFFALKHYTSCVDIAIGRPATPEMVKEKAGDLLNYYIIYCCLRDGKVSVDIDETLMDLSGKPRSQAMPWVLGYQLLKELK